MSNQDLLKELFGKFLDDKKMTPEELSQLQSLVHDERNRALLDQLLAALYEQEAAQEAVSAESNAQEAFAEVLARLESAPQPAPAPARIRPLRRHWWKYAAAVLLPVLGISAYYLFRQPAATTVVRQAPPPAQDIQPGGNKAVLTLADGSTIALDQAQNGTLGRQGNTQIVKLANGQLAYQAAGADPAATLYNTITTPRGGRYQVILPDGSRVWLNAASSLRYPAAFNGATREVTLTGEAYFEITPNAAMPFRVRLNEMEVDVLGTRFNVMAYTDEDAINTTLLEGAVKVTKQAVSKRLAPGQRASLHRNSGALEVQSGVNTEEAIAWKNGLIQFEGSDIHAAMRMIARWYNVEVEYQGKVPDAHFRGVIPSNVPVSQVLDMLELTGEVHFEVSGRKIIVTP